MNMISYAAIEMVLDDQVVCEVENISVDDSKVDDFNKEIYMANIPVEMFTSKGISIMEGNVYSVEHDGTNVVKVIKFEEEEQKRRAEYLQQLQESLRR